MFRFTSFPMLCEIFLVCKESVLSRIVIMGVTSGIEFLFLNLQGEVDETLDMFSSRKPATISRARRRAGADF